MIYIDYGGDKLRYTVKTKRWYQNMDNIMINYLHIGEETHMRFINMYKKCRLDRVACSPKNFRCRK